MGSEKPAAASGSEEKDSKEKADPQESKPIIALLGRYHHRYYLSHWGDRPMGIVKVDGRVFLDSGTVIVAGDAAIEIEIQRAGYDHEVALKFRTAGEDEPDIRVGNPNRNRTVIHFINFAKSETSAADYVRVGSIGKSKLRLSYVIRNFLFAERGDVWLLSYTFYAEEPNNG